MRCVDCEMHDCVVGTHFCNYKGKSGRRRPRRVSEEDAYKDVPCEYAKKRKEQTMIKYLIDVIKYMRKFPCGNGNRRIWLRNCLYVNWQKPWKWNLDIYWLWKQFERSRR